MHKERDIYIFLQKKCEMDKWIVCISFNSPYKVRYFQFFCTLNLNITDWLGCFLGETLHSNPLYNISRVKEINKMFLGLSTKSQHDRIWLSESCKIYLQHPDPLKLTKKNQQTKHYKPPISYRSYNYTLMKPDI